MELLDNGFRDARHPLLHKPSYLADPLFAVEQEAGTPFAEDVGRNTLPAVIMRALNYVDVPKLNLEIRGEEGSEDAPALVFYGRCSGSREIRDMYSPSDVSEERTLKKKFAIFDAGNGRKH